MGRSDRPSATGGFKQEYRAFTIGVAFLSCLMVGGLLVAFKARAIGEAGLIMGAALIVAIPTGMGLLIAQWLRRQHDRQRDGEA